MAEMTTKKEVVRYDEGQSLTDEEKAQARQNIGAADEARLTDHAENGNVHVTSEEKATWNGKADAADIPQLAAPSETATDEQAAMAKAVYNLLNSTVNSLAAFYITKNAQKDAFATKAELFAATAFYNSGVARTPTRNDYAIVLADETHGGACTRWSFQGTWGEGGGWEYQYTVNETALTQAQLNALNSGITAELVEWLATFRGSDTGRTLASVLATINAKYAKPSGGIPKTDLASAVQTSLGKADAALQAASVVPVEDTSLTKLIATIGGKPIKAPEGGGGGKPTLYIRGSAWSGSGDVTFQFDGKQVQSEMWNNGGSSYNWQMVVPCSKVKLVGMSKVFSEYGGVEINGRSMAMNYEYTVNDGDEIYFHGVWCLVGDTAVSVPGGGVKRIDELEIGDKILAMSPDGKIVEDVITQSDIHEDKRCEEAVRWEFEDDYEVTTVHRHRLYNVERGAFVYMDEWKMGEHARTIDGKHVALLRKKILKGDFKHYRCIGNINTQFANGLLAGNRYSVPPKFS